MANKNKDESLSQAKSHSIKQQLTMIHGSHLANNQFKGNLRAKRKLARKTTMRDFQVLKIIGKGAFGEVRIVKEKETGLVFAMKTMVKKLMIQKGQTEHLIAERDLMVDATGCHFLVQLIRSFQDAAKLYLVMEYCGGGDLMGLLIKKDILSPKDTSFYMAELAVAINHIHKLHYVHRDLKPDNVLIGNDGHIRLSDFGLAKMNKDETKDKYGVNQDDKHANAWTKYVQTVNKEQFANLIKQYEEQQDDDTKDDDPPPQQQQQQSNDSNGTQKQTRHKKLFSTVGTPDYIALEVLYQKGYNHKVDWWSMGVIMFECLVGYAPFHAQDPLATCRKIVRFEKYFVVPNELRGRQVTNSAQDLMNKLVTQTPKRLEFDAITKHPFFKDVPWDKLTLNDVKKVRDNIKQLEQSGIWVPPDKPTKNEIDNASHFDEIEEEQNLDQDNVQSSGYSSSSQFNNRFWGYTSGKDTSTNFNEYLKQQEQLKQQQNQQNQNSQS